MRTREVEQMAEKRMIAYAETNPEVQIRYHSVADGHVDEPALVVLGSLLSGRTGRLYKSLVLDQKIANSVSAGQNGMKWEGYFLLERRCQTGQHAGSVEQALYKEIEKLQKEKVSRKGTAEGQKPVCRRQFQEIGEPLPPDAADPAGGQQPRLAELQRRSQENRRRHSRRYSESRQAVLQTGKAGGRPLLHQEVGRRSGRSAACRTQTNRTRPRCSSSRRPLAQMPIDEAKAILQKVEPQVSAAPPEKQSSS